MQLSFSAVQYFIQNVDELLFKPDDSPPAGHPPSRCACLLYQGCQDIYLFTPNRSEVTLRLLRVISGHSTDESVLWFPQRSPLQGQRRNSAYSSLPICCHDLIVPIVSITLPFIEWSCYGGVTF